MKNKSEISKSKGHTRVQWTVSILVNTSVLTYGLQCGWISPMSKLLQSEVSPVGRPLTDSEISLIAGLPSLASIGGILILVYVVDTFGRKKALLTMSIFQLMCWIIKLCPPTLTSLIIARIFCGLGAGGCFHVVPMYVKEISQDNIRGTLGSMCTLFQNLGILTMYALGGYLDYRIVLYLVIGIPILTMVAVAVGPESPSFMIKQGKPEDAAATMAFLRGLDVNDKEVQAEVDMIQREDDYFKSIPNISFFTIFKEKAWRRGFIIMILIITMHGLNGSFSIVNYASTLLAKSETTISPELQTLTIPIFLIIGTSFTMGAVDKLGRKCLLGSTFGISTLTFAGLATTILLHDHGWATPEWLPIVIILVTVCSYGAGVSPAPFIIMTEMFNFQIRAKIMACLCILAWLMSFVQLISFAAISSAFGAHMSFYVFSAINLIGVIVVIMYLPETGGKRIDEIEEKLRGRKKYNETSGYC